MRITINTVILMHLYHLALDHWRSKTLFFNVILSNSQISLKLFWGDSQWSLMILSDLQTTLKSFLGQLSMILGDLWISLKLFWGDSQWISVICKALWNHFWDDSWWLANQSEIVLGVILVDSQWFSVIRKSLWKHFHLIFGAILSDFEQLYFQQLFRINFLENTKIAPVASILNRCSQTRYHFKA